MAIINGTNGSDTLNGTAGDDFIFGQGGSDVLAGLGGADFLDGGAGADTATYAASLAAVNVSLATGQGSGGDAEGDTFSSIENLTGSAFDDTLEGSSGNNVLTGGDGTDTVSYAHAAAGVTVSLARTTAQNTGGAGSDTLSGFENLTGSHFDNTLTGSSTANTILSFEGNDVLAGLGGADILDGGTGNDTATYAASLAAVDVNLMTGIATGGDAEGDTLVNIENLTGSSHDDVLEGDGGNNVLAGGGGNDTVSYEHAAAGVTVSLALTTAQDTIGAGSDTLSAFENLTGSHFDNILTGTSQANVIVSFEGNDTLNGGAGADTLIGGAGNDTYIVDNAGDEVTEAADEGTDTVLSSISYTLGANLENLTLTGAGNLSATGNAAGNVMIGNGGNNTLAGLGGADALDGDAGTDTATYAASAAAVNVSLATGLGSGGDAEGDTLVNIENLTGSGQNDTLEGNGGNNFLAGGSGNDTVSYAHAAAAVTVNLAQTTAQNTIGAGTDTLTGFENLTGSAFNDTLTGNGVANILIGGLGNDTISASGGSDRLDGGGGDDSLTGGTAADIFVYASGGGADVVTDFSHGQGDRVDVTDVLGIFGLADIQSRATQQGANTVIDFGNGDTLTLQNVTLAALVAGDFIFPNSIVGTPARDTLIGTSQADAIFGLAENDRLQGLGGNDQLDGGTGFDRAVYTDATGAITVNMAAGTVSGPGVGSDLLTHIEGVVGSDFVDTFNAVGFTGSSEIPGVQVGLNEFEGRGGDDVIIGSTNGLGQRMTRVSYLSATAAVTVDIAAGTADGNASVGHDTFSNVYSAWGSAFNDTLRGSDNNAAGTFELFEGRRGDDFIDGRGGYDRADYTNDSTTASGITVHLAAGTVTGDITVGTDTLRSVEAVRGTNFDDLYDATGFGDAGALNVGSLGTYNDFVGAGGNDTIIGNGSTRISYQLAAGAVTADLETSLIGTTNAVTVAGSATALGEGTDSFTGVNSVQGSTFGDTLLGSSFNNTLIGLAGDDYLDGRGGFDTAGYNNLATVTAGINVNLAAGTVTGDASVGTDTLRSIEAIQGTGFADVYNATGFGIAGALNIGSNGTSNQFEGLGGDDTIIGNGNTRLIYTNAASGVTVNIMTGIATGDASVGTDTFSGVNGATGSVFGDVLIGGNGTDFLTGGAGNDFIDGGANPIGNGDAATYGNSPNGVVVNLGTGVASDGFGGTDTLVNIESVIGSAFNDVFTGSAAANEVFDGGAGNDIIDGGGKSVGFGPFGDFSNYAGATGGIIVDLVAGTAGGNASVGTDTLINIDSINGTAFNDVITGNANANLLRGFAGSDVIHGGDGDDQIEGGQLSNPALGGNDYLYGDGGNDAVYGGSGNDLIDGGAGNDNLTGKAGADTFVYASGGGADFITDFSHAEGDRIDVTGVPGIFGLAEIQSHATQQGLNTVINFGNGDIITLQNVVLANLVAGDFIFPNNITGTPAPDVLIGTSQADAIFGLAANDRLQGLGGNDQLNGGTGFDRAIYADATGAITVNLAAGSVSGAGVGVDTLTAIEGIVGSDFADTFNAVGFTGSSEIPGVQVGLNEFEGRGGDDLIVGSTNVLGLRMTRVSYLSATAAVTVDIAAGTADGNASVGHDTFSNVFAASGSAFNDTLRGSDNGTAGTFELFEGRAGDDFIDGRGGYDRADYTNDLATMSGITVHLAAGTVTGDATIGTDTLRAVEAIRGTNFDDLYDATGFGDVGAVNVGSLGTFNDFAGAGGNDTIIGNGSTRLNYQVAAGAVTADLETSAIGTTNAITVAGSATALGEGTDSFTGANAVQGSMFNDTLLGSSFGNTLIGLGGDDYLDGRGGFDTAGYNSLGTVTGGINVNLASGVVTGDASVGTDTLRSIEGIQGTGFADVYNAVGFGQVGALNVGSNGTFNQFEGLGGDDSVTGNGNTRLIYSNATSGVTVSMAAGAAAGDASVGTDTFTGVNSVMGSNFADSYNAAGFVGFNSFQGQGGNDTITGNGSTQLLFFNATSGVLIDLAAGTASGDVSVGTDTITGGVNSVFGSNFNDTILGSGGNDFLNGGNSGNDTLDGRGGNDNLNGGTGADIFVYAVGGAADFITDFNHVQGDRVDVTGVPGIFGLADIQSHATQQGANTVINFGNGDTITLQNVVLANLVAGDFIFPNNITGTPAPDVLIGTSQADAIFGLAANDRLQGLGGNDQLDGGLGFDRAVYTDATGGITANLGAGTVSGAGVGNDTLTSIEGVVGSDFADTFVATGFTGWSAIPGSPVGSSEFEGRGGNDVITGLVNASGQTLGRISYVSATAGVTADLIAGTADGDASVGHDTFSLINAVVGSAYADVMYGSNNLNGTFEQFDGRGGNDFFDGRGGFDYAVYNNDLLTGAGITVNLASGIVSGDASIGTDTLRSIEAVRGTSFNDTYDATGFSGASANAGSSGTFNQFEGMAGDDSITGNGNTRLQYILAADGVTVDIAAGTAHGTAPGDAAGVGTDTFTGVIAVMGSMFGDTLLGGSGNEQFLGLAGDDYIDGRGGFDFAQYSNLTNGTGGVSVDMASGIVTGDASSGTDTLRSIEAVQGTIFNDVYDATGFGGGGALNVGNNGSFNQFEGLGGNDTITGNGNTQLVYSNATAGVSVDLSVGVATGDASVGTDTITGGVNRVIGSNFGDTLIGTGATEFLNGMGGNDTISGGGGNDVLTGGSGNDNFVFASGSTVGATITDFAGNGPAVGDALEFHGFGETSDGATLTWLSGNQWQVHSGLDGHDEIITINGATAGSIHVNDYQFLT